MTTQDVIATLIGLTRHTGLSDEVIAGAIMVALNARAVAPVEPRPPVSRAPQDEASRRYAERVPCPTCNQPTGRPCVSQETRRRTAYSHKARRTRAARSAA